jgi:hypothetical protein
MFGTPWTLDPVSAVWIDTPFTIVRMSDVRLP